MSKKNGHQGRDYKGGLLDIHHIHSQWHKFLIFLKSFDISNLFTNTNDIISSNQTINQVHKFSFLKMII
jgi:hypothetical protein